MATLNNPHDRFFKRAFGQREVAGAGFAFGSGRQC